MKEVGEIIVLTGAAGCLGYHTLKCLISRDEFVKEIRCLDLVEPEERMLKSIDEESRCSQERKLIKWIKGDVRDINVVEQTLAGADCVIHCAAKINVWSEVSEEEAGEMESINVGGTETLLQASIRLGVHKFIHVSSFEVYTGLDTILYATEATLPDTKWYLFGASASTKKAAEDKVKQYSNTKLVRPSRNGKDFLHAIIIRFPTFYGEYEKYYIKRVLEVTKFLGGTLRKIDNIWISQQPVYVGNAAWSLIKAKQRMDKDESISGEEFHITDETAIGDPFEFVKPYLECKGMKVTESSYPFLPLFLLIMLFFTFKKFLMTLDLFGIFAMKKDRLQDAIEKDRKKSLPKSREATESKEKDIGRRWYNYITTQTFGYMGNTNFLNRTKASLRLDYDPIIEPEEARQKSLEWYKNCIEL